MGSIVRMPGRFVLASILLLSAVLSVEGAEVDSSSAWKTIPGGVALAVKPTGTRAGFTELTAASVGILWTNQLSPARYATRQNLMNGAGLAAADVDGDGWCDLFLANKEGGSGLFRNLGGWRFTNITSLAGVDASHLIANGAVFADFNADGRPDLFVTSFLGPDALYLNLGGGRFTNVTTSAGVASKGGTTSAAAGDVDGDGDLDLYVCHFGIEAILRDGAAITTRTVGGKPVVSGRFAKRLRIVDDKMIEYGEPDVLFLNDGQGRFQPAPASVFVDEDGQPLPEMPPDFGLAVQIRDLDGNGTPDIYVCNDFHTPDRIWYGDGKGRFRAARKDAFRNMSYASMGVDAADLDHDGHYELFTVEMLSRDHTRHLSQRSPMDPEVKRPGHAARRSEFARNVLQWNRGDDTFAEIAWFAGVAMSDWSWTPIFIDVDLDGHEDLLVSNGHMHDVNDMDINATRSTDPARRAQETARQMLLQYPRLETPKAAWRNRGDLTFEDAAATWGFRSTLITHGMVLADLDNDGDADVVGNAWDHPPLVYRNDGPAPRLAVRLRGPAANADGIGARIRVRGGAMPLQEQQILSGGRYLSSDQPQLTFATGTAKALDVEVLWPDGRRSEASAVAPNQILRLSASDAKTGAPSPANSPANGTKPLLTELKVDPPLRHAEEPFDDFARQPTLPRRLSQFGPAVALLPSGTGYEVIVGTGRGGRLRAIRIHGSGQVESVPAPETEPFIDDTTGLVGCFLGPGSQTLFVGLSHFESGEATSPAVLRFDRELGRGPWRPGLPIPRVGGVDPGPLACADLDGDGRPELIVAGRHVPGRYPEPADTRVYRFDGTPGGPAVLDSSFSAPLAKVGMVTGMAVSDFDGDGKPDLALACEWGAIRLFRNDGQSFRDVTEPAGLSQHTGLWQSLAAGDFDQDGRPDLAAGNWGRNTFFQRCPEGPWELWYGDFAHTGRNANIEAYLDPRLGRIVPTRNRDVLSAELGWLTAEFPRHRDYAQASVSQLLGARAADAKVLRASRLDSVLLLNRGGRFEVRPLPPQAQWTPIPALAAVDIDADGTLDLVAAQNLSALRDEDDRMDSGLGLVMVNDGKANFSSLSPATSGLHVAGDQTAVIALPPPAHESRTYAGRGLVIAENAGPLHAFRLPAEPPPR